MLQFRYRARAGLLLALLASILFATTAAQAAPPSFIPGRVLVGFRSGVASDRVQAVLAAAGARSATEIPHIGVHVVQLPPGASEVAAARAFAQRPEVVFAELDQVLPPALTPNDPYYSSQWHLPKISAPTAWNSTTGSSTVIIAILDTGCDPTHPDLASKYVPGWNFYDNNSNTSDVTGHGSAVAGTAAAISNNGTGVASVAWGCLIMPIRVSSPTGSAYLSTIANALTWAADHGTRVANISYTATDSVSVTSAAQYFQSKGGVVAVAAGNSGTFDSTADNPYVLTVSATDSNDVLASFSNTGNNIDLAAPGVSITTIDWAGGYASWTGTSVSAPIVAGVAALVISANASLTASQVQDILKQSADDLGPAGWDPSYGWGRVNAARAVSLAGGAPPTDTTPPTVSFASPAAGATVSGTITVQVNASDNVAVTSVSLKVDGTTVGTVTSPPYNFPWNTTTVANGTHTLTATASDGAGNTASASITVTVNNGAADTTPPTISITSPVNGATVSGNVFIAVIATDNVGVVKVELYVDGALKSTSTTAPFTTNWNARKAAAGPHTLQCKAYDAAGNVGSSAVVTVYK